MKTPLKNSRKKIIIAVDDNPAFAEVLRVYLAEENQYQLLHFTSSKLALDFLQKFPDDVAGIISDIMMKEVDGFEFLDQVRNLPILSALPFIFISGVDTSVFRDFFKSRKFTAFLPKPLAYDDFMHAVTEHFGRGLHNHFNRAA